MKPRSTGHLWVDSPSPLRPALRRWVQRKCRRGASMHWLCVGRRWHRRPVDPHTRIVASTSALHRCVQRLCGWSDLLNHIKCGMTVASIPVYPHTGRLLSHQCTLPVSVASNYKGPPQGPWLVLGESCPYVSNMKQLKHLLDTFPQLFIQFRLLKISQMG